MTRQNIELLTKDLSCRIPYGVIVNINGISNVKLTSVSWYGEVGVDDGSTYLYPISEVKPYLFPLSSMTEEEKKEYYNLCIEEEREEREFGEWITRVYYHNTIESIDWLTKNHFDYRGLIPMGLANDATKLNIY